MLKGTLRATRSRFVSISTPLLRVNEDDDEDVEAADIGRPDARCLSPPSPSRRLARLQQEGTHGLIPLGGVFTVLLALFLSLLFTFTISLAFANANESLYFRKTLDDAAKFDPGVVLVGEAVDVDIDELETAVSIRWTMLGCGEGFILSGSPTLHGSKSCGVLAFPVSLNVEDSDDNNNDLEFDPAKMPREPITNRLLMIETLMQFETVHDIEVHSARFYPFDTYLLTTSLRVQAENQTDDEGPDVPLRISAMPIVQHTTSFALRSVVRQGLVADDEDDFHNTNGSSTRSGTKRVEMVPVYHLEMSISRPGYARAYAMLVFGINWLLAHCAVGVVVLAKKHKLPKGVREEVLLESLKYAIVILGILLAIPQLRAMMPDAPEFHGALIDTIGFFPQMSMIGISLVLLLLLTASRVLDAPRRRRRTSFCRLSSSFAIPTSNTSMKNPSNAYNGDSAALPERKDARLQDECTSCEQIRDAPPLLPRLWESRKSGDSFFSSRKLS